MIHQLTQSCSRTPTRNAFQGMLPAALTKPSTSHVKSSGHKKASRLARPMSVKSPSINSFCNFWTCCLHCLADMQKNPGKTKLERFYALFLGALWWISGIGMDERILLFFSDVPVEKRRNLTTFSGANGCHTARCIPNHLAPSLTCVFFCPFPSPKHRFWSYEMFHQNTRQTNVRVKSKPMLPVILLHLLPLTICRTRWAPFVFPGHVNSRPRSLL